MRRLQILGQSSAWMRSNTTTSCASPRYCEWMMQHANAPLLCNIRTLFPPARFPQSHLSHLLKQFCDNVYRTTSPSSPFPYSKAISALFQNTCINYRHFMFSPEDILAQHNNNGNDSVEDFNKTAINNFSKLTQECVDSTLQDLGIGKKGIFIAFSSSLIILHNMTVHHLLSLLSVD